MVKSSQDIEMVSPLEEIQLLVESHADDGDAEEAVTKIQQQNRKVMDAVELVMKLKIDHEVKTEWENEHEVPNIVVQEEIVEYPQIVLVVEDRRLAFDGNDDDEIITIGGRTFTQRVLTGFLTKLTWNLAEGNIQKPKRMMIGKEAAYNP